MPGSTIALRKSAKPTLRKADNGTTTITKKLPTYKEKQAKWEMEYDLNQVNFLTQPTEKQGQKVPSWEEKTGMFLIDPDYENY